jgi:hypothetical protein
METLAEAIDRLQRAGFRDSFRAEGGMLRALEWERRFVPEELVVEETVRFEGVSDPDDEAILFALRSRSGDVRGTWAVSYGPGLHPDEAELLRRLGRAARPSSSSPSAGQPASNSHPSGRTLG